MASSQLVPQTLASTALSRDLPYLVYLPDGYDGGAQTYPVLYLLHGADGDETVWVKRANIKDRIDALVASGKIPPTLVVMPACPGSWWIDGAKDKAETAFWTELVPTVENRFRATASKQGRLMAGVSAGGFGAVHFALKYPDRIAAIAAFSPAIYAVTPPALSAARRQPPFLRPDGQFNQALWSSENYPRLIEPYLAQKHQVGFYLVSGDADRLGIAFETALFFKTLYEKQPELSELRIVDGGHDWDVWGRTLDDALTYIYRVATPPPAGVR